MKMQLLSVIVHVTSTQEMLPYYCDVLNGVI